MKRSAVDCGDKKCTLEHVMSDNCYLYFHTNSSSCNIPCNLEGCRKELHHSILCPIWKCHDVSTTTTASSTSTTTKTTTIVPTTTKTTLSTSTIVPTTTTPFLPIPIDHPGAIYVSLTLNCFLFLMLVYILLNKCKKGLVRRFRNFRNRNENDSEQVPILVSSENGANPRRRQRRHRNAPLRQNNDGYFTLSNTSEDETDGFARINLNATMSPSPRVASFLNSPEPGSVPRTNLFRDPLGYFWPQPPQTQTETIPLASTQPSGPGPDRSAASAQPITIPLKTQKPLPPSIPTRSPTTSLTSTFKPTTVRSNI